MKNLIRLKNLWKINTNMVKINNNQNKGYALLIGLITRVRYDETKISLIKNSVTFQNRNDLLSQFLYEIISKLKSCY